MSLEEEINKVKPEKKYNVTIYLSESYVDKLDDLCEKHNVSRSVIFRIALDTILESENA